MTIGYHGLVALLRGQVPETTPEELAARLDEIPVLIDIREPDEVRTGVIPGAVHVPRGVLEGAVERLARDTEIVLYCSGGNRSILAGASLQAMGFTRVSSLAGGTVMWRMGGHPISVPGTTPGSGPDVLTDTDAAARYARHLVLPEIGPEGQQALAAASVLVVGAGGLGSPVCLYLAAAGVGRITIADPDVVDVSNLQRQVVHDSTTLGRRKVDSAAERMRRINPGVIVTIHPAAVSADTVMGLIEGHDLVVDTTDNFPTRYLLNDAALRARVPLVHGSVFRFEGQVSVFLPYAGPCYRCLFPMPPPPELAPNCATAGVLGPVTGVIGSVQATEAIKLITGAGSPLVGSLLVVDTLSNQWGTMRFGRDPACPACGDEGSPPELVDYDASCRPA